MTQTAIAFRRLHASDAPALMAFYNGLSPATIRTFRPLREKTTLAACQTIVQANCASPAQRVDLAAWHGDQMIGWAFLEQLVRAEPQLGLGVTDTWQRQGIGSALVDGLLTIARQHTVPAIYLIVVHDNQPAIHLYQSRGFVVYDEHFDTVDQLTYLSMKKELA